ncbi:hypothetical protein SUGI_0839870 [Cryptomeria japonica]|nr:hypothetical protein SUGI_0839870 [Cryptomeria japonica]
MAASSSSSTGLRLSVKELGITPTSSAVGIVPYDVFINFRGCDVRKTLASTLYRTLCGMGLSVFVDYEVSEPGDNIAAEIESAILNSSLYVAIFSKNYARSPWCMAELSLILQTGKTIIPVFYHVEPSDMRLETGGFYAQAFLGYEGNKKRYSSEKLQQWRMALHNVSLYPGYLVKTAEDEKKITETIANSIWKTVKMVPLLVARDTFGLDEVVDEFERSLLESTRSQKVEIVGIVGIGGSGKTTLAKAIYDRYFTSISRSSFISSVRDAKTDLRELQKKLLDELRLKYSSFFTVERGRSVLAGCMSDVRVLIVLDDVDRVDQLDDLMPAKETLGSGSLIIVTTRELGVLTSWGISSIYKMGMMRLPHARKLFCRHAFLQPVPLEGFEDLVEKFLSKCNGLPLWVKVLGGDLYDKSKNYWESQLDKITRILPENIRQCLKISYDSLDQEEQEIFLDIACFFIGEKKSLAIAVWDGSGWNGENSWQVLENKCLVEIDGQNRIRMHDHLRDLGREIAVQHLPHRLISQGEIADILTPSQEITPIRGIMTTTTQFIASSAHEEFPRCSSHFQAPFMECVELMKGVSSLKLLAVTENDFTEEFATLSRDLVWLRWFDFKHSNLPSWLSLVNLRVLELFGTSSLNELWKDNTHAPLQLRELRITTSWGSSLERFPSSISCLKYLKKLSFIGYFGEEFRIERLPEEFCDLQSLEHLELRHCKLMSTLPIRFGELTNLRYIDLCSSEELRMLPDSFKMLRHLQYLDLSGCHRLFELPCHITKQTYLRELHVRDTCLRDAPDTIVQLRNLQTLRIGSPLLKSLPASIGGLSSLTCLEIDDCLKLESLPDSVGHLNQLQYLSIKLLAIMSLPKSICQLTNLQTLEISDCPISELDLVSGNASFMPHLKAISLTKTSLSRISISKERCPELQTLLLQQNDNLVEIEILGQP